MPKLHKDMLQLGVLFTSSSSYHPKNNRLGRHEFELLVHGFSPKQIKDLRLSPRLKIH